MNASQKNIQMRQLGRTVRIVGCAATPLNSVKLQSPTELMAEAFNSALQSINIKTRDISGLIAIPSLAEPHFMEAHYFATLIGLLPGKGIVTRTLDSGGAGPISAILMAKRMIQTEGVDVVAVVAGDAVKQLSSKEFLERADGSVSHPQSGLSSPMIPNGYDRIAQYQMKRFGTTRRQLASCSALMSLMAMRHPFALTKQARSIDDVLNAPQVAPVTSVLECARRADGGACVIIASSRAIERLGLPKEIGVVITGGGEASGPLFPPKDVEGITEDMFSCEEAVAVAFDEAQVGVKDIDFFGLYDCFPICLIRAVEAVGLAPKGHGGSYIELKYHEVLDAMQRAQKSNTPFRPQDILPLNTHGGLLAFGAPWEVPAMYNVVEAFAQLTNNAGPRQIRNARRALVYGNGGIFSHSSVAILGSGRY